MMSNKIFFLFVIISVASMVTCEVGSPCPPGEEYNSCGSACPKTCANKDLSLSCIQVCRPGCFCKEGTYRDANGKCTSKC
ncbi:chymotrypsin inhibitor-like [Leguminivora glycinivorella]|uniref:chymotrypsin inhibitor-like n=1 Tax=Leguminivora glycinivorella TaxID=1035111 RepID=UPI00200D096C|nr:chymotrypsin inhibitor-like [Leguminivora glycinivorella]